MTARPWQGHKQVRQDGGQSIGTVGTGKPKRRHDLVKTMTSFKKHVLLDRPVWKLENLTAGFSTRVDVIFRENVIFVKFSLTFLHSSQL